MYGARGAWRALLVVSALCASVVVPVGAAEASIGTEEVTGRCTYSGVVTSSSGIRYVVTGAAVAHSTSTNQPYATVITCTLVSPQQPFPGSAPTTSHRTSYGCPGAVCATTGPTEEFLLRPVLICTEGYALFGPTLLRVDIPLSCSATPL